MLQGFRNSRSDVVASNDHMACTPGHQDLSASHSLYAMTIPHDNHHEAQTCCSGLFVSDNTPSLRVHSFAGLLTTASGLCLGRLHWSVQVCIIKSSTINYSAVVLQHIQPIKWGFMTTYNFERTFLMNKVVQLHESYSETLSFPHAHGLNACAYLDV